MCLAHNDRLCVVKWIREKARLILIPISLVTFPACRTERAGLSSGFCSRSGCGSLRFEIVLRDCKTLEKAGRRAANPGWHWWRFRFSFSSCIDWNIKNQSRTQRGTAGQGHVVHSVVRQGVTQLKSLVLNLWPNEPCWALATERMSNIFALLWWHFKAFMHIYS